jgi:internalin A
VLNLGGNQLTHLPESLGQLTALHWLDLGGNALPIPPEILAKSNEPTTIINYYLQQQQQETFPLNEAKMLVVGQANVGKTSLVKRLLGQDYNPHENKTEGIDILPWDISVNESTVQLNVWDFGGQEIYHATHQFFLTKRSLYLLVIDVRQGEEDNRIEYWLKIIQSYGGDSPILIIGNKIDQHPLDLDQRGLQGKYTNIKRILETSCETGEGINTVRNSIREEIALLDHVGDRLPKTWFEVKTRLEEMDKDYISYEHYERICEEQNVTEEENQGILVRFLHDLGIVLNFQDDPRLEDTHVLNPEWVTNGVYQILNDRSLIIDSKGVLKRQDLTRILDRKRYPRSKHIFITDMMRKFELCFPLDNEPSDRFLIPDLLSKEEPDTGDWEDALVFEYHYNVLPNSIISRFIVRTHLYISKHTYWRTGVVLAHEGNRALVKSDREEKIIYIRVSGNPSTRRNLLAVARSEFDHIHSTIPRIEAQENLRLPQRPDIILKYDDLLKVERSGRETWYIPELNEEINVIELLNGFESGRDHNSKDPNVVIHQYGKGDNVAGDGVKGNKTSL